jgi:hypothetical protein
MANENPQGRSESAKWERVVNPLSSPLRVCGESSPSCGGDTPLITTRSYSALGARVNDNEPISLTKVTITFRMVEAFAQQGAGVSGQRSGAPLGSGILWRQPLLAFLFTRPAFNRGSGLTCCRILWVQRDHVPTCKVEVNKRTFLHRAHNSPHNFSLCGHDRSSLSFWTHILHPLRGYWLCCGGMLKVNTSSTRIGRTIGHEQNPIHMA